MILLLPYRYFSVEVDDTTSTTNRSILGSCVSVTDSVRGGSGSYRKDYLQQQKEVRGLKLLEIYHHLLEVFILISFQEKRSDRRHGSLEVSGIAAEWSRTAANRRQLRSNGWLTAGECHEWSRHSRSRQIGLGAAVL